MPSIHLTTFIAAPIDRVFDLSRHIGLHKISQQANNEEAIGGVRNGLIEQGQTVTWQAKHLYKLRTMTMQISKMEKPLFFEDIMLEGDFKKFEHKHHFKQIANGTIMIDELYFETPYNFLGALVNRFYLTGYLQQLLENRNATIKEFAESSKWKAHLDI